MINDLLRNKLEIVANDELLIQAINAVFDEQIEQEKPQIGEGNDDALLGQKFRAYELAKQIITKSFVDLASYKINKKPDKTFNKER